MAKKHVFCFICTEKTEEADKQSQKLTTHSFAKVKEFSAAWAEINYRQDLYERIKDVRFSDGYICHKNCYGCLTRTDRLQFALEKCNNNDKQCNILHVNELSDVYEDKSVTPDQSTESCESYLLGIIRERVLIDEQTVDFKELEDTLRDKKLLEGIPVARYIKQVIEKEAEISSSIEFFKSHKKHTIIAAKSFIQKTICKMHYDAKTSTDDYDFLTVTKKIREELSATSRWTFDGDFNTFVRPKKLEKLMTMFIGGTLPKTDLNKKKRDEIALISQNVCDYIFSNYKFDRAIKYKSKSESERGFENTRLSPLTVGTSLLSYANNRSRVEIDHLHQLGFGISYDSYEKSFGKSVWIVFASIFSKRSPTYFRS